MRKGENKTKEQLVSNIKCSHRVVIPLYIPDEEGYYIDAFKVFELCLFSVLKTSVSLLKVSVISNGSCKAVNLKLSHLQQDGYIDELIIEKESVGKINSVLKVLRSAEERLITVTDADVLFLNNWEQEILNVFKAFPNAGMVSPVPVFRTHLRLTENIWFDYLFSNKLKFRPVLNPEALTKFANSIGWPFLRDKMKDVIATISAKDGTIAVLGNSHFVGTYKQEVFKKLPKQNSNFLLGGDSEYLYLDLPVVKSGGYRLATYNNYAFHIGNTIESWIKEEFDNIKSINQKEIETINLPALRVSFFKQFIVDSVFKKILYSKKVKYILFKQKGLNKVQLDNFINGTY